MKIIDAHHHLWDLKENYYPWLTDKISERICGDYSDIRKNYLVSDFLEDAKNQNLEKSVHIQAEHDPGDPVRETRWLQGVADSDFSRGFPHAIVAYVDFSATGCQEILENHCKYNNVKGVRQTLHHRGHLLKNNEWWDNIGLLKKYNLSFDLQVFPNQVSLAAELVKNYEEIQFILCHSGLPAEQTEEGFQNWRQGIEILSHFKNVSIKISGFGMFDRKWTIDTIRPYVIEIIDRFGFDRCMFGSNFPVDKMAANYDNIWKAYEQITSNYSEDSRLKLFHDNAKRYYRL